jgi:catechol 2,3-dioxygenase-like lactoylglutathione lyase family enzyme
VTATFAAVQVLPMFDVAKARMFYVGHLGFHVDWEHRFEPGFPLYMQVSQNGLTLHLSEHHGDGSPGVVVVVRATGLEAYQAGDRREGLPLRSPGPRGGAVERPRDGGDRPLRRPAPLQRAGRPHAAVSPRPVPDAERRAA